MGNSAGKTWEFVRFPDGTWLARVDGEVNFQADSLEALLCKMQSDSPLCAHGVLVGLFKQIVRAW